MTVRRVRMPKGFAQDALLARVGDTAFAHPLLDVGIVAHDDRVAQLLHGKMAVSERVPDLGGLSDCCGASDQDVVGSDADANDEVVVDVNHVALVKCLRPEAKAEVPDTCLHPQYAFGEIVAGHQRTLDAAAPGRKIVDVS